MYNKNKKQSEMDAMWEKFGNKNIRETKSKALDEKYWENNK